MTEPDNQRLEAEPEPLVADASPRRRLFFARLAAAARRQDWFVVALEVAIVVLGVIIGFQVTAWGQAQQARAAETQSLRELRKALSNDLEDIRTNVGYHHRFAASALLLQRHLDSQGPYADTLDVHFGHVMGVTYALHDVAAYETLKQRGLETITNDSIRSAVGRYYGFEHPAVAEYQDRTSTFVFDNGYPYYNAHFQDLVPTKRATPVDYTALATATDYATLVDWAAYLHPQLVAALQRLEARAARLIALLDDELADR